MNRRGLLIALLVAVIVGAVFGFYPQLDLAISRYFFNETAKDLTIGHRAWVAILRDAARFTEALLVAPAVIAIALKLLWPTRRMLISGRAAIFMVTTLALAPGIAANVLLKDMWGRPRPIDVTVFNGADQFVPWWDPRGTCPKNCSFVSGEASAGFWTLAPASLAPPAWRPLAYAGALGFGAMMGTIRMAGGGHFFSDTAFAGVVTFLIVWLVHGLIYRWPATRWTDEGVELAFERIAGPPHRALMRLFGRGPAPPPLDRPDTPQGRA
jgi:membrane-associated PAP2 superfamily phosphatase